MASGIPKRASNVKKKEKRKRSWEKNQEAKKLRIAEQQKREANNKKLGTTGKQRAVERRKAEIKAAIIALAQPWIDAVVAQEDLLEI